MMSRREGRGGGRQPLVVDDEGLLLSIVVATTKFGLASLVLGRLTQNKLCDAQQSPLVVVEEVVEHTVKSFS